MTIRNPIDRKYFFAVVRQTLFHGKMTQTQVDGMNAKLGEFERRGLEDYRWLAYIMATSYHETGRKMMPVREGFATSDAQARRILRDHKYVKEDATTHQSYYGRGDVQLTWKRNYDTMGKLLELDLAREPDLALIPSVSAAILFEGMIRGSFTGKKLEDFFNLKKTDWVNARKIINGLDRAELVANYAKDFRTAIREGEAP